MPANTRSENQLTFREAVRHHRAGMLDAAEAGYRAVLDTDPAHVAASAGLGALLRGSGRPRESLDRLGRASVRAPHDPTLKNELALTLLALHRFDEAEILLREAVGGDPAFADTRQNLAGLLMSRGRYAEALDLYRLILGEAPESARAHDNVAKAHFALDQLGSAISHWRVALAHDPQYAPAWRNLGDAYRAEGAFDAARECYDTALRHRPHDALSRWNKAMSWLAEGNLAKGWPAYASRASAGLSARPALGVPEWLGQSLAGKHLLVQGEQGVGDEIMFASCIPDLLRTAARVTLVCERRLAPIFSRSFTGVKVVGTRVDGLPPSQLNDAADLWCLAGSLPGLLRPDEAAFGGGQGYLAADPDRLAAWRTRYNVLGGGLKIGLSWRGGKPGLTRHRRSIALQAFARLFRGRNVHLINLQYGDWRTERASAAEAGLIVHEWDDSDPLVDLDDFAAKVAALDLVISVDNTTVHLAGALGAPTWVLLPKSADWRWMTGRNTSPWYGALRLFRQVRAGDWAPALASVGEALGEYLAAAGASSSASGTVRAAPRALLLNDTSAWYHWGCTCTSRAIRSALETRGYGVDSLPIDRVIGCSETPEKIADFTDPKFLRRFQNANHAVMQQIASCDLVVVNGEGTLHGTGRAVRNLLFLMYAAKRYFGRPLHIINHSCFPENAGKITHMPSNALYKIVYDEADSVAVREPISLELLRALGIRATLAFDSLPLFVQAQLRPHEVHRQGLVLAGSVAWRETALPALARMIGHAKSRGEPVTVLTGAAAHPAQDDMRFVEALRAVSPAGWSLREARSAEEWLDVIQGARLLVSGRFHHTIAALCLRTPFVALASNTPKMEGMLDMAGQGAPLSFTQADLAERIVALCDHALDGKSAVLDDAAFEQLCVMARQNFAAIAAESDVRTSVAQPLS